MSEANNFQRVGSKSNAQVGRDFERLAQGYFQRNGLELELGVSVSLGFSSTKEHKFDLGRYDKSVLIECKSHRWTNGNNIPCAKMTVWNEVMLYFSLAPAEARKILFVLKDFSEKRDETLAQYYFRTYKHLIPDGVIIQEYDEQADCITSYP